MKVTKADKDGFEVWDGSWDQKWPDKKVGLSYIPGEHPFKVGDDVDMLYRLRATPQEVEQRVALTDGKISYCETHGMYHIRGHACK